MLINEFGEIGLDHDLVTHSKDDVVIELYGVLRNLGDAPDIACPLGLLDAFVAALEDDLNFPRAIAELFRTAKAARRATTVVDRAACKAALRDASGLLGLLQQDPAAWFGQPTGEDRDTARIRRLVEARLAARSARDFVTADRIRDELAALGVVVQDRADGPAWQRTG